MARIWVASDFQGDVNGQETTRIMFDARPEADVLVVAGDFNPPLHESIIRLSEMSKALPVVYVPGNRDYYSHKSMSHEMRLAREVAAAAGNIHILDDEEIIVAGTRFIGATLWSDMKLDREPDEASFAIMNDFRHIHTDDGVFRRDDYLNRHQASKQFVQQALARSFEGPTVVVTHHAPHPKSVGEQYAANTHGMNAFFTSDLSDILESSDAPQLWVHGATHVQSDYQVGKTRVISNPVGYRKLNENPTFNPYLVIESCR